MQLKHLYMMKKQHKMSKNLCKNILSAKGVNLFIE